MKRPTMLLDRVLLNEALQVSVAVERDIVAIRRRFEHEGMSFLTITLPSLCDALDKALAEGRLTPSMFNGFKPFKRGGKLPALLHGFFSRVFGSDGSLLERPCVASIRAIRQVTRLWKKVELPCSPARVKQAFERYVSNDEGCQWENQTDPVDIRGIAGYLWSDLERFAGEHYCSPGVFGSGATAEQLSFNERHTISEWPLRSEEIFPASYHATHREDDLETLESLKYLAESDERPVRVVQVPKTLKTPRIISVEPSYMMLMQQSIAKPLMDYLESSHFPYGSIRFTDQTVNKEMARIGSLDGSLATIDLKDASDLVSLPLVRHIFSVCPAFLETIEACRSTRAKMPDKSVIELRKFASMGSALCFPVEAMVFFTIVIGSMVRQSGRRPSPNLLRRLAANVSVYGDDIIVPTHTAAGVIEDLEAYGLKVNRDKSFLTGSFRESCGGDYYKGVDVTPSYIRHWDGTGSTRSARILSSYISLSNQFYLKGLWNASQYIRDFVRDRHGRPIPRTTNPVGGLTFASVCFNTGLTWDNDRNGWRVKAPRILLKRKADRLGDIRAVMLRSFSACELSESRSRYRRSLGSRKRFEGSVEYLYSRDTSHGLPADLSVPIPEQLRWATLLDAIDRGGSSDQWLQTGMSSRPLTGVLNTGTVCGHTSEDSYSSYTKNRWVAVPSAAIRF